MERGIQGISLEGPCRLYEPERAGEQAAKILSHFRKTKQPVIFIQHLYDGGGYKEPKDVVIAVNSVVEPMPEEPVIQKHFPNSLRETTLKKTLDELGVEQLVVVGMMSYMCIDTSVSAADLGYGVIVIEDACTTMDLHFKEHVIPATNVHASYMAALQNKGRKCFAMPFIMRYRISYNSIVLHHGQESQP